MTINFGHSGKEINSLKMLKEINSLKMLDFVEEWRGIWQKSNRKKIQVHRNKDSCLLAYDVEILIVLGELWFYTTLHGVGEWVWLQEYLKYVQTKFQLKICPRDISLWFVGTKACKVKLVETRQFHKIE